MALLKIYHQSKKVYLPKTKALNLAIVEHQKFLETMECNQLKPKRVKITHKYIEKVLDTSDVIPCGIFAKRPEQKYTGTLIKGISTMHKSNGVPVINDQDIKDIARMRR